MFYDDNTLVLLSYFGQSETKNTKKYYCYTSKENYMAKVPFYYYYLTDNLCELIIKVEHSSERKGVKFHM